MIRIIQLFIIPFCAIIGQANFYANPFDIILNEKSFYDNSNSSSKLIIRPLISTSNQLWSIKFRSEYYLNSGAPNFENLGDRYIGKGLGVFTTTKITYNGKSFTFIMEPFYLFNQNKKFDELNRRDVFSVLNDEAYYNKNSINNIGISNFHFFLNIKEFGLGISNSNHWWGPGIHTSLTMTNNAPGFPHIMIGTINEKRIQNVGYNFRYLFSKFRENDNNFNYNAIILTTSFYSNPVITIGLNHNLFVHQKSNIYNKSIFDYLTIIFKNSEELSYSYQTLSTYFMFDFPKSGLKIFFELGANDKWENFADFINYPDHGIGSLFGFRDYGLFNNNNLVMGFEYARLLLSSYERKRNTINWHGNPLFNYTSYKGRRWSTHSGSDSDDLYIYIGYQSNKWSFIPSINYERHGIIYTRPAEVKIEVRFDFRYNWKEYHFNIFYEREWLEHPGFEVNKFRHGNVIWFGIERDLTNIFSSRIGLANN